jgi:hypothetical protein
MTCSDLCAVHQRKYKKMVKAGFLIAWLAMKSLLVGTWRYLCNVYNYHDSRACSFKRSGILSRLDGLDVEWF